MRARIRWTLPYITFHTDISLNRVTLQPHRFSHRNDFPFKRSMYRPKWFLSLPGQHAAFNHTPLQ